MKLILGWVQLSVYTKCVKRLHDSRGWNHSPGWVSTRSRRPSWNSSRDENFHVNVRRICPRMSAAVFPWRWRNPKILSKRVSILQHHFAMLMVFKETYVPSERLERIHWWLLVHRSALAACLVLTMLPQLKIAQDNPASSSGENSSHLELMILLQKIEVGFNESFRWSVVQVPHPGPDTTTAIWSRIWTLPYVHSEGGGNVNRCPRRKSPWFKQGGSTVIPL